MAGSSPFQAAVHTRRIVDPLVGFKLSGKLGAKNTLGAIFSLDEVRDDPLHLGSGAENAAFAIFRYKRALRDDSYVGAFYTGREQGSDYNRLVGLDGQLRLSRSETLSFHGFASFTDTRRHAGQEGDGTERLLSCSTRDLRYPEGCSTRSAAILSENGF